MTATRYLIRDAESGRRLAAASDAVSADEKASAYEARGHRVAVETVTVQPRRAEVTPPQQPKPKRRPRERRPMRFYNLEGMVYCRECRDNALTNAWRVQTGGSVYDHSAYVEVSDEPPLRPRSFEALADRPWAGNEEPERYVQCDSCNGQWGPDA